MLMRVWSVQTVVLADHFTLVRCDFNRSHIFPFHVSRFCL